MSSGGKRPGAGAPKGTVQRKQRSLSYADRLRDKINAGKIIGRLSRISEGLIVDEAPQLGVQVRAGEVLLRKVLPDLQRAEVTGNDGGPLEVITRAE